jgi:hypothetical protein
MDLSDPLYKATQHYDTLNQQVNKVSKGYRKNSLDISQSIKTWIKKLYISIPFVFLCVLILLWLLDLGIIKNSENETSVTKLFIWSIVLTIIIWIPLYFFVIRKLN